MYAGTYDSQKGVPDPLGTEVIDGCEPPDVIAGNKVQVLCKNSSAVDH